MKSSSLFLIPFLLFSCQSPEEENAKCSSAFLSSLDQVKSDYRSTYQEAATATDLSKLISSATLFLSNYENVKCQSGSSMIDPTAEVRFLLQDIGGKQKSGSDKVVYGVDNRVEVDDSPNANFRQWAQATASQIPLYSLSLTNQILGTTIGVDYNLCSGELFTNQKNPARCSGFLVAPDILITAGHCMTDQSDCDDNVWAFNFRKTTSSFLNSEIYTCKQILAQAEVYSSGGYGPDYAVVQLDREVTGVTPLNYRKTGKVANGTSLVVIGNPSGLPTKIADGATIRNNSPAAYFVANLDTFGGNSGSAVIDVNTGLVEGILVRGETDYVWGTDSITGGSCRRVNVCSDAGCRGEDVTRMTVVTGIPVSTAPVNGGWGVYGNWSSCVDGEQYRERQCNSPAPANGGNDCVGVNREVRRCVTPTKAALFSSIFDRRDLTRLTTYGVIPFWGYEEGNYILMGRKFLDICGLQIVDKRVGNWQNFNVVNCGSESSLLDQVFEAFQIDVWGDPL